jgi:hypothetical protein
MWLIIAIFAVAAVVGLTMAIAAFQGHFPPVPSAILHGVLAATGLVLLLAAVFMKGAAGPALWALGFFLVAALGGFGLALGFHARRKALPKGMVAGHAILAVIGFLLLLGGALKLL